MANSYVISDDYHSNHNFVVPTNDHHWVSWDVDQGDGIYGDFEITDPSSGDDQIITFFICDSDNYDLWSSGESASVYHLQENVDSYSFDFKVPSDDTWYFVFRNYALFYTKTINFDLYMDLTPPEIEVNLDSGATYSGIKEITATITEEKFDIESVELRIDGVLKDTEYDESFSYSWNTEDYANGAHTLRITASDDVGNSDYTEITVYTSNALAPGTTSDSGGGGGDDGDGATGSTSYFLPMTLGLILLVTVAGIAMMSRGKKDGPTDTTVASKDWTPPTEPERTKEREIVSERYLIVCPYCSSKTEQGSSICSHCGAKL